jgi:rhodanese-related sulfurtransferase
MAKAVAMEFEITPTEVKQKLENGERPVLLDVREPVELQMAHIEGTVNIPMGEVPMRVNQELDPDAHIVVLCHHGVRSLNVTNWLRQQGFEKVQSMRGGIDRWSREVDSKVPTY